MFQVEPYQNRWAPTLATLVGGADRARAAAMQQAGQLQAEGVARVGDQVGATLNNIVRYKVEEPEIKLRQQQVDAGDRALKFNDTVNKIVESVRGDTPDQPINRGKLQQLFAAARVPLGMQEQTLSSLDAVD